MMQNFPRNTIADQLIASVSTEEIDRRNEYAALLNSQKRYNEAFVVANEIIKNSEVLGYIRGIARAHLIVSTSLSMESKYDCALEHCNKAIEYFIQANDNEGEALALYSKANCYLATDEYEEAQKHYQSSLLKATEADNKPLAGKALNGIGSTFHELGDFASALGYFQKSIGINEELGDKIVVAGYSINLGNVYAANGNYAKSYECYTRSLEIFEESGDKVSSGDCTNNIGLLYYRQGNYSEALNCFLKGIKLWKEIKDYRREAISLHNIANIYAERGEFDKTLEYFFLALSIEEKIEDKHGEADTLQAIGNTYFKQKNFPAALDFTNRSLDISKQIGNKDSEAKALTNLGSILAATGDYEAALSAIQNGLYLHKKIHNKSGEAECLRDIGKLYILKGNFENALTFLNHALQLAEELQSKSLSCQIHQQFTAAYSLAENYRLALEHSELSSSLERQLFSKENSERINQLQAIYELETARHESEIHRLKTIELAEANRQLIDLNRQKSDFLTIASHDLKNPLSNVTMLSKLLRKEADHLTAAEVADFASDIQVITERMFRLVKKFLDINALEAGKITPVFTETDITALIQELIHSFRPISKTKSITIVFDEGPEHLKAVVDETMLTEVIDNLVSNALKYSPREKKVEIRLQKKPTGFSVSVQDEGPGISETDKQRLFKSFARLSALPTAGEDSSGLGLFITKKMVELLGGSIFCESTEGHGATFVVEIETGK